MKHRTIVGLALLAFALAGCQRDAPQPVAGEASLAEQIAAVERGETTRILVEREVLGDRSLMALGKLATLTDLLLDNADSEFHAGGVAFLAELSNLRHLRIRGRGIDNECLRVISKIESLRILNVPQGVFDDAGLVLLTELPKLEQLRFGSPLVSDEGMKTLARFPALRRLHLIDVPLTDAGLAELAKLDGLQSLYIDGANVSDAAWDELFRARPKLHVHINQSHHDRDPARHAH